MQAQSNRWFGPAVLFLSSILSFGIWQYQQWLLAPAPELTWGCGPAAGVIPAGVNLPAKPAFNWWLLAAHSAIAIAVVMLSALIAAAAKFVIARVRTFAKLDLPAFTSKVAKLPQIEGFFNRIAVNIFGLRAPPVVVW